MNQSIRTAIHAELDRLTAEFFRAVSFEAGEVPPYDNLYALFIVAGLLIKNTAVTPEISGVRQFIEPRFAMVRAGELTRFREVKLSATMQIRPRRPSHRRVQYPYASSARKLECLSRRHRLS